MFEKVDGYIWHSYRLTLKLHRVVSGSLHATFLLAKLYLKVELIYLAQIKIDKHLEKKKQIFWLMRKIYRGVQMTLMSRSFSSMAVNFNDADSIKVGHRM